VDEHLVAAADGVGGVSEVVGGHALEHGSGSLLEGDGFGDLDEAVGGGDGQLGIGSGNAAPGDAVTNFYSGNAVTNGDDGPGGLLSESIREFGRVTALAEVDVNEVHTGGFEANKGFARSGCGSRQIAEGEDFGSSGGENLDGLHGALDARKG